MFTTASIARPVSTEDGGRRIQRRQPPGAAPERPSCASVGANLAYGAIHQSGGEAGPSHKATIPARAFPCFAAVDRERIGEALEGGAYIGVRGFDPIVFENDTCSLCVHRSLLLPYNTNVALA